MSHGLMYFFGAIGVVVLALSLVVMAGIGLVVWLGGTEWTRRSE